MIANEVAHKLNSNGCECSDGKKWSSVSVRFAGFYDPANQNATRRAGWDALSPNITSSLNVAAAPFQGGLLSRRTWVRPKNYGPTTLITATHSGFMGAPTWSTEKPGKGYSHAQDIAGSIKADRLMRGAASSNGVPIESVSDYDFGDLPW